MTCGMIRAQFLFIRNENIALKEVCFIEKLRNKNGELIIGKGAECLLVEDQTSTNNRKSRTLFETFKDRFRQPKLIVPKGSLSAGM